MNLPSSTYRPLNTLFKRVMAAAALGLLVLSLAGLQMVGYFENQAREDALASARVTNDAVADSITLWTQQRKARFQQLLQDMRMTHAVEQLTDPQRDGTVHGEHPLEALVEPLRRVFTRQALNAFALIAPDGRVITHQGMNATDRLVLESYDGRRKLKRALEGKLGILRALSERDGQAAGITGHSVYLGGPIYADTGEAIAVLVIRLVIDDLLAPITAAGRFSASGETYAVDVNGTLLTPSRFGNRYIGNTVALPDGEVTDEAQTETPALRRLTYAASELSKGLTGGTSTAYLDYRGIPVIGVWRFIEELEIGVITEIDEEEMLTHFTHLRRLLLALLVCMVLFTGGLIALLYSAGIKQRAALEREVQDTTQSLVAAESWASYTKHRYDMVLDSARLGVVEVNAHDEIVFCNRAARELLGHEETPIEGMNFHDLAHHSHADGSPYDREECPMHAAVVWGEQHRVEGEVLWRADGESFEVSYDAAPMFEDGQPSGAMVLFSDISERMQAERKLRASESEFRTLVQAIPGVVYRCQIDEHWTMLYLSEEIEALTGYTNEQLVNNKDRSYGSLIVEEDQQRVTDAVMSAVAEQRTFVMEYRLTDMDGGERYVLERGIAVEGPADQTHLVGTIIDITDRRKTEIALQQSKERLLTATAAGEMGMWEFHPKTQEVMVSRDLLAMRGYDPDTLIATNNDDQWGLLPNGRDTLRGMIHLDDLPEYEAKMRAHMRGELESFRVEYRVMHAGGYHMWVLDTGRVVESDEHGIPTKLVGVVTDIDQLKTLQSSLETAKAEAEAATQAKSDFLAKMTHEIRTPLNAVLGLIHLALKPGTADARDRHLQTAQRSIDYIVRIVNDILDFSKIEAGAMTLEVIPFELSEIMMRSQEMLTLPAEKAGLNLSVSIAPNTVDVLLGDPYRLEQILINLVNNAIKFTPAGGLVEIRVKPLTDETCDDPYTVQFSVRDTGVGMTPEQQARLFQSYSQADNSIARQYGGTGLGLVVSQQLTQLMGGEIWVESEKDVGSTFHFTANFGRPDPVELAEQAVDKTTPGTPRKPVESLTLMVVEDNDINREVVSELLEGEGVTVIQAEHGKVALEKLEAQHVDGVLMDCQMPVMDGYQTAQAIRAQPQYADLPIIAMTGNTSQADIQKALDAGMNDHLAKPIDPERLLDDLSRWFS